jgi:hypothetical protein
MDILLVSQFLLPKWFATVEPAKLLLYTQACTRAWVQGRTNRSRISYCTLGDRRTGGLNVWRAEHQLRGLYCASPYCPTTIVIGVAGRLDITFGKETSLKILELKKGRISLKGRDEGYLFGQYDLQELLREIIVTFSADPALLWLLDGWRLVAVPFFPLS